MAIFRKIHTQFWSDPFVQSLSPEKKYFYLYLLTNEKTRQCGIYEITSRQISYDTGYNTETVLVLLEYFVEQGKIKVSRETNEIAVKNWNKYNASRSPDVKTLVTKELMTVKNRELTEWVQSVRRLGTLTPQGEGEQEPEKEREEEVGSEKVKGIANEVWKDQSWKEQMCIGLNLTMEELKKWLAMFNASMSGDRRKDFDKSLYKKFSRGWIVKQKERGATVETGVIKKSDSAPLKPLNGN